MENVAATQPATDLPSGEEGNNSQFCRQKLEELHRIFDTFDQDCDGFIEEKDAIMAAYCGGPILFEYQVKEMFKEVDRTHIGKIDMGQFFVMILRLYKLVGLEFSDSSVFVGAPQQCKISKLGTAVRSLMTKAAPTAEGAAEAQANSQDGLELTKTKLLSCLISTGDSGFPPLSQADANALMEELAVNKAFTGEAVNIDTLLRILNAPIDWKAVEIDDNKY